jgi:hypothetical protein
MGSAKILDEYFANRRRMDMVTVYGEPRSLAGVIESGHGNSLG